MEGLQCGDVVRLVSGAPAMTVQAAVEEGEVEPGSDVSWPRVGSIIATSWSY